MTEDSLGWICEHVTQIRDVVTDEREELEQILSRLREHETTEELIRSLTQLLRRAGITGGIGGGDRGAGVGGLPGLSGHPIGPKALGCPLRRCGRVVLPEVDPPSVPRTCLLHDVLLRPLGLPL